MLIITNNPLVKEKLIDRNIYFVEGEYGDVLEEVRRQIVDKRLVLLTHPLSGSIKPNETYYKSVMLTDKKDPAIDMDSLEMIEHSIAVYEKFIKSKRRPQWTERVLRDFALIDYDLIQGALSRMQIPPTYL